ncbi:MAG: HEAT repeat domain-containing protein, partial [Phycisphaerales bacterium]
LPLKLRLVSPNHARANVLQQVIDSYFPQAPGQRYQTAHGESDESIEISIPPSYRDDTWEFVHLLMHTPLFSNAPEQSVGHVARTLRENPGDSDHASWRWQAIGTAALPSMREFYTYPEAAPRFAALRAGARLNDALVEPHLLDMARDTTATTPAMRKDAIALLGEMQAQPRIVLGLRELLNDDDVDVRIAAYEALINMDTPFVRTFYVDEQKYQIDFVDSNKPLIYVTLIDQPRIVVFGLEVEFDTPLTFSTWSGKFLMKGDDNAETIDVAYLDSTGSTVPYRVSPRLHDFIPFLGHTTTVERPQPGLGLTYTEVVGLLAAIHDAHYLPAEFRTEQDRIRVALLERAQNPVEFDVRPEFDDVEGATPVDGFGDDATPLPAPPDDGDWVPANIRLDEATRQIIEGR